MFSHASSLHLIHYLMIFQAKIIYVLNAHILGIQRARASEELKLLIPHAQNDS